ncbi:MAG: efflux RND transporter periplasmic adaptor subunit, partial [Pseudomonadota bacterium]|nr:efflux RND transporter periplasmic adaptor subunit [Pseudomonadota bacterium]
GKAVEGKVKITLPDNSDYRYWGEVNFTDPQLNPKTGTFAVRASVPNPDRELLPGQYTQVQLVLDIIPKAVVIHEKSIQIEQGGTYVMIAMPDGTAERRFIVTGARHEAEVVVDSGLAAGEKIISEGFHKVIHGQRIRTISAEDYSKRLEEEKAALLEESTPTSVNSDKKGGHQ